jgi:colanic acid/amylovoran biosynthesis glycosyltransferase
MKETEQARLIYILDRFPGDTLNFIYNEIRILEQQGLAIDIHSLLPAAHCPAEALPFMARTTNVRPVPPAGRVRAWWHYLLSRPGTLLSLLIGLPLDNDTPRKALRTLAHIDVAVCFAWLIRDRREHLHSHFAAKGTLTALVVSRLNGNSYSFTAHGSATVHPPSRLCLAAKIRGAEFIVSVSEFNRRVIGEICPGQPEDKVMLSRCGIDPGQFPFSPPAERETGPRRILCVASLFPVKNHETLIDACAILAQRGIDFQLDLVGKDVDGRQEQLRRRAARAGIDNRISFHGSVDHKQVTGFLARADLFVLTSHSEGVPVAMMEAMAMGIPVVGPRITGVPELVVDGDSGLLADPARPGEFASAMARLLGDGDFRASCVIRARHHVEEHFNLDLNINRLAVKLLARLT